MGSSREVSDHPAYASCMVIGVIAGILALIIPGLQFFTGKQSLQELIAPSTTANSSIQTIPEETIITSPALTAEAKKTEITTALPLITATVPPVITMPTERPAEPPSLTSCPNLGFGETRTVNPKTYILGDIVVDGVRHYDDKIKEITVAYFLRQANVYAEWGAGCYQGDLERFDQILLDQYVTGCITGCLKVRAIIFNENGSQDALCYYPDGTTANLQTTSGISSCP